MLAAVNSSDAVLIGGQAVNVWAYHYLKKLPELQHLGPFTSKDIDFFGTAQAAAHLAKTIGGRVILPRIDDATPNSAVVIANMNDRKICIDFMASVLGVKDTEIRNRVVVLEGNLGVTGERVGIALLHPVDCLKSKLANINILHRQDIYALNQAKASILIVRGLIDDLLDAGETRKAIRLLGELFYLARNECIRRNAYLEHGLNVGEILIGLSNDPRIDTRWRQFNLKHFCAELRRYISIADQRKAKLIQH